VASVSAAPRMVAAGRGVRQGRHRQSGGSVEAKSSCGETRQCCS
jgi:hypothetical protein